MAANYFLVLLAAVGVLAGLVAAVCIGLKVGRLSFQTGLGWVSNMVGFTIEWGAMISMKTGGEIVLSLLGTLLFLTGALIIGIGSGLLIMDSVQSTKWWQRKREKVSPFVPS